jgi:hypothetical protein
MAENCKLCQIPHGPEVLCVHAQAEVMKRLLALVGNESACRSCGAVIFFVRHRNGKEVPYTGVGLNHFIDCPAADNFRRKP